jgi:peptidoglycan/LPS O-acetylase OafA/YrhL
MTTSYLPDTPPTEARRPSTPATTRRIPYEAGLDGMRGLAVLAVVLFHAEIVVGDRQWFGAGFLGVDAFFVLSGFLITALLIVEFQATGRISLRDFWVRRARRLLPALLLVVGAVVAYAVVLAEPGELDQIRRHGLASLFYVANWQFISEGTSYFAQFAVESPFAHMWSLAIEEQWYLVWPIVVYGLLRWTRSVRVVMWCSLAGAVASAAWMAVLFEPGTDPSRVYFGTDTRAQSLLLGAALSAALISGVTVSERIARHLLPAVAAIGGLGLAAVWVFGSWTQEWYYRGGFLLLATVVSVVIVAAVQPEGNIVRTALSWRPLVALGVISYGIYLWHWPIFLVLSRRRGFLEEWTFAQITALRLVTTLVVTVVSYALVEGPVRRGTFLGGALLGGGVRRPVGPLLLSGGAAVLALLLVVTTNPPSQSRVTMPATDAPSGTPEAMPEGSLPTRDDLADGIDPSTRPIPLDSRSTSATKVLVVGDSVAYSMATGFTPEIQERANLLVWNQTVLFCELARGPRLENGVVVQPSNTCSDWEDTWRADVAEFTPDVAILQVGAWEIFNRRIDGEWLVFGTGAYDRYFLELLDGAIEVLSSQGATVVLLSAPHMEREDTMSAREWTQNETWRTDHVNGLFEQAARDNDAAVHLPFARWVCPDEHCHDTLPDGRPLRSDGVHFTDEGAIAAARWLAPQLRAIALNRMDA